ncbi:Restriction endonuclease [Candidatus Desulfarcum epimagneticum]|uniref:Restriction endonuclease n=1 Tax=uncultured Desulfobacteraceae bacterium TaxID=218296 RepID=A0A484HGH3_9BACT|nr:Restriction endonuclease [uncultured Desulfobacteraceae bacterium]
MSIWLVRAGSSGEYESKFLDDNRIYLTWKGFKKNVIKLKSPEALREALGTERPDAKDGAVINWASQIWAFGHKMKVGDWVALPSRKKASIHFGKIKGDYEFLPEGPNPYYHARSMDWFAQDIPRSNFDQDILYSFGAFMTICRISRNDAENRIKKMSKNDWKSTFTAPQTGVDALDAVEDSGNLDIERFAKDQIAKFLTARYSGHGMARLVEAILKSKGFMTYRSPEGPDKGVDLLAGPGALGFESPKICVQVKTGDTPVDRPTLDQLIGAMQNFGAESGLLVSWSGFKRSVDRELPSQFFRVRLWDQDALIEELLESYEKLDDEIKAELPFKRIWAIASSDS